MPPEGADRAGRELEDRDRDAIYRLQEAGIGPGSKRGLAWRFRYVDRLSDEEVSRQAGVKLAHVRAYASQVNRALREAALLPRWAEEDDREEVFEDEPAEDDDEDDRDPLLILAAFFLVLVANRRSHTGGTGFAAPCSPLVSAWDMKQILQGYDPYYLPVVPRRGKNRDWRKHVG